MRVPQVLLEGVPSGPPAGGPSTRPRTAPAERLPFRSENRAERVRAGAERADRLRLVRAAALDGARLEGVGRAFGTRPRAELRHVAIASRLAARDEVHDHEEVRRAVRARSCADLRRVAYAHGGPTDFAGRARTRAGFANVIADGAAALASAAVVADRSGATLAGPSRVGRAGDSDCFSARGRWTKAGRRRT